MGLTKMDEYEIMNPSNYWWYWITGPYNVTFGIKTALESDKNVALFVPEDLPWRKPMRLNVKGTEDAHIEIIDLQDDTDFKEALDVDAIGEQFLKKLEDHRFRGETIQDYLSRNEQMANQRFWIKGMDEEQEKAWISFCKGFKSSGHFILELKHTNNPIEGNFEKLYYDNIVDERDLFLFNTKIIDYIKSKKDYSNNWKQYAATICTSLCGKDAEISERLLNYVPFKTSGPGKIKECLECLSKDKEFERRGVKQGDHVFWHIRNNDYSSIDKNIWKSQLQVFFPMIEQERIGFIETFREELKEALKYNKKENGYNDNIKPYRHTEKSYYTYIEQRDETGTYDLVSDPDELELQTIIFMLNLEHKNKSVLYIPEIVKTKLKELYELRNLLAHVNICEIEKYKRLLDEFPFNWEQHRKAH